MRSCGILLHISSLPNKYGIGTLGKCAYEFVDFLSDAKQTLWQVLPLGPTSYGDSPYQGFSTFAGNPYFIDLDLLKEEGLLEESDYAHLAKGDDTRVDYGFQYNNRFSVLRKAFDKFDVESKEYKKFKRVNKFWLNDYALFMTLKDLHNGDSWWNWEDGLKLRKKALISAKKKEYAHDIEFWCFVQYKFFEQWFALKEYANSKGIKIVGDIPIYVAQDSSDVWSNPTDWQMDENLNPTHVAGCPPDGFSELGQLWGNPIYNYDKMKEEGYPWWVKRMKESLKLYDIIRIDHFRGFAGYYSIKFGAPDARNGEWVTGPGISLFNKIKEELGEINVIAEDLGLITEDVAELLEATGFPGMKVLQFGFNHEGDSVYLPHNYPTNCVVYPGTHDNQTVVSWFRSLSDEDREFVRNYLNLKDDYFICENMARACLQSSADTVIIQFQDYIGLTDDGRMNTPSVLGGNWQWRATKDQFNSDLAQYLAKLSETYRRSGKVYDKVD